MWRRFRARFNKKEALNRLKKIKDGMSLESKIKRYLIVGFAAAAAIFCFSISIYWMARADSANRYNLDSDVLKMNNDKVHLYNQCAGSAADVSYVDLHEVCGEDHDGCR